MSTQTVKQVSMYLLLLIGVLLIFGSIVVVLSPDFVAISIIEKLGIPEDTNPVTLGGKVVLIGVLLSLLSYTKLRKYKIENGAKTKEEFVLVGGEASSDLKDDLFKSRIIKLLVILSIAQTTTIIYLFISHESHTHSAKEIIDTIFEDDSGYLGEKLFPKNESVSQYGDWEPLENSLEKEIEAELNRMSRNSLLEKASESSQDDMLEQVMKALESGNANHPTEDAFQGNDALHNSLLDETMKKMEPAQKEDLKWVIKEIEPESNDPTPQ